MLTSKMNQNGMAVIEMIPIMIVVVLLVNFCLGFFGIVHTANLNAISARNYTFEGLKHRSNVNYHRETGTYFGKLGHRYSGIISQSARESDNWIATARRLSWVSFFGGSSATTGEAFNREPAGSGQKSTHNSQVLGLDEKGSRNENVEVYNVWIRSLYGICVNSQCGESGN